MKPPSGLIRQTIFRLRALFRRKRFEADMSEELRAHLEMQEERNRAAGMAPEEARYAARRQFGGVDQIKETARDQRGWVWLETLAKDFRYAVRSLTKSPGFTLLAALSIGVGIGVNCTIFSAMDAAFLRPLPFKNPEELVRIEYPRVSLAEYREMSAAIKSLSGLVAVRSSGLLLQGREGTEVLVAKAVSSNYFTTLGISPTAGRLISEHDENRSDRCVVISHSLWQRRFGADPKIVGETITLNEQPATVLGVAAQGFVGEYRLPACDVWYPIAVAAWSGRFEGNRREFQLLGRLRPEFTIGQARAEIDTLVTRVAPDAQKTRWGDRTVVFSEYESTMDHGGKFTFLMGPIVGLVLLIACGNVSCMLLARYEERRREIAVRLALGSSRARLMRNLLTEGLLLSLLGAASGLVLTAWGIRALPSLLPPMLVSWVPDLHVDGRVLGLGLGLSMLATLAFGLLPAWRASQLDVATMLKTEGAVHLGRTPSRNLLVVLQVAISLMFLGVAALFIRGFSSGWNRDLGFSQRNLLLVSFFPGKTVIGPGHDAVPTLCTELRQSVAALPGIRAVTMARRLSLGEGMTFQVVSPADKATGNAAGRSIACNLIDAGYFSALGIHLLHGRDFTECDDRAGGRVIIVSETMAHRFWPGENPVGQTVLAGREKLEVREVVGVVGDVGNLSHIGQPVRPFFYLPLRQEAPDELTLIARTEGPPARLAASVRATLDESFGGRILTAQFETMGGLLRTALLPQWFGAWLGGVLGLLAFVLAISGLYGVVAYAVSRRTRELGIRIALGAEPAGALWLVLRQGLALALIGVAVGLPLAVAVGVLMRSLLFGISPADPVALAGASLLVVSVALFASYIPARRAAQVDPMVALRAE